MQEDYEISRWKEMNINDLPGPVGIELL